MADNADSNNNRVQIILAILTLVGGLGTALITHWSDIFGPKKVDSAKSQQSTLSSGKNDSSVPSSKAESRQEPQQVSTPAVATESVSSTSTSPPQTREKTSGVRTLAAPPPDSEESGQKEIGSRTGDFARLIAAPPRTTLLRRSQPYKLPLTMHYRLASSDKGSLEVFAFAFPKNSACQGSGVITSAEKINVLRGERDITVPTELNAWVSEQHREGRTYVAYHNSRSVAFKASLVDQHGNVAFRSEQFLCYQVTD